MSTRSLVLAALCALALPVSAASQAVDDPSSGSDPIGSGFVEGLFLDGALSYVSADGTAAHGSSETLTPNHLFEFPAMTEMLLAVTIRALDAAGQIDADAPLGTFVAGLDEAMGRITLHQLLTHTAGLSDAEPPEDMDWNQLLEQFPADGFVAQPGALASRSRYSFPVVARVLEKLIQAPIDEIISAAVLQPLGMNRTTFDLELASTDLAVGYVPDPNSGDPLPVEPPSSFNGLPVACTTAPDLIQFAAAWMGGALQGTTPLAAAGGVMPSADEPRIFNDGVWIQRFRGAPSAYVSMTAVGFSVVLRMFPEANTILMAWSNGLTPVRSVNTLETLVAASLELGDGVVPPPLEAFDRTINTADWVGTYQNGPRTLSLTADGSRMTMRDALGERLLLPIGNGVYAVQAGGGGPLRPAVRLVTADGQRFVVIAERAFRRRGAG